MPLLVNHSSVALTMGGVMASEPILRVLGDEYAKYRGRIPYGASLKTAFRAATVLCALCGLADFLWEEPVGFRKWAFVMGGADVLEIGLANYRAVSNYMWAHFNYWTKDQNQYFTRNLFIIISLVAWDCFFYGKT